MNNSLGLTAYEPALRRNNYVDILDKVRREFDDVHKFKARKADENQSHIAIEVSVKVV